MLKRQNLRLRKAIRDGNIRRVNDDIMRLGERLEFAIHMDVINNYIVSQMKQNPACKEKII